MKETREVKLPTFCVHYDFIDENNNKQQNKLL